MSNKLLVILLFFLITNFSNAQSKGAITGKIKDKQTNETLIGASISIVGTNLGSTTDLDGNYEIRNLQPGKYNLRVSYISYQTTTINDVVVESGKATIININLEQVTTELNEVIVSAEALKSTEAAILNIQKNSMNIVDGMSVELIKKNNSSDGIDILRRMTGVTISDGKYAFVRGVSDRYNSTLLNGSTLPSTDPEKKSFSYDLFPASLIENVLTSKTFVPDKPADFSGGLVEINTVEFPSNLIFDFSFGSAYINNTTGKVTSTYNGGKTDYLGIDDGTRSLPSLVPKSKIDRNLTPAELENIGKSFSNNWDLKSTTLPINSNFKFNLGNKINLGEEEVLGYIASLTYSNSNDLKETYQANYTYEGPRYIYNGVNYNKSINWGALLNVSLKLSSNNKISLKNVYNNSSDDETIQYEGDYSSYLQYRKTTSFRFVSRSLQSSQLIGEHNINFFNGLRIDWNLNFSNSKRNEPDARRYVYARDLYSPEDKLLFLLDQSLVSRFYGNLDDQIYGAALNFKLKLFDDNNFPEFKFGFLIDRKSREFDARIFGFRNVPGGNFLKEQEVLFKDIKTIFSPENINPSFIEIVEITQPTDSYYSDQDINSAYILTDFSIFGNIKVITGLRYENSIQKMNTLTRTGEKLSLKNIYNDLFPSLNISSKIKDNLLLRLAITKTISRPEFRELATFTYFDFVSNELVMGNPNLIRSLINNYDLRFEYYPTSREMFAVSLFYKQLKNPIEQILISSSGLEPTRSYENAKEAKN
ncbi:MAG: TonB-dependent receptor, partial [Melioribacteraceae bacterium]|nr:TonB-dependent receptor [Melioribacteraceae bacterium]